MRLLMGGFLFIGIAGCVADTSLSVESDSQVIEVSTGARDCRGATLALQVLGSGGPFLRGDRASTSYLLWVDGHARVMVDAGGGAFVRFGESGARIEDLRVLAISHFHPDHSSDLPAILWTSTNFRSEPLAFVGPSGDGLYPGAADFLNRLFDEASGAFPGLSGIVGGGQQGFPLPVTEVDAEDSRPAVVFDETGLRVSALGVPHNAPALAFRVQIGNESVVFGSDQTGTNPGFAEFARDASVLVMHLTRSVASAPNNTHALPDVVGRVAREAAPDKLVLSHLTQVEPGHARFASTSLPGLAANVAAVREHYKGEVIVASDLLCIGIGKTTPSSSAE